MKIGSKKSDKVSLATLYTASTVIISNYKGAGKVELHAKDIEELKELIGKNAIVIFSNGQIKAAELPTHGQVEITSHDNKVKSVEQKVKHLF